MPLVLGPGTRSAAALVVKRVVVPLAKGIVLVMVLEPAFFVALDRITVDPYLFKYHLIIMN